MHKNIRAAVIGRDRDKAISAIWVEEFDPPTWHAHLIRLQRTVSAPDPPRRRATATDRGLAHALRLFGTKRVMPKRVIPQKRLGRRSPNSLLRPHISGWSRQPHRKHRAFARLARHCHVASHHARELAGEGKTEPRPAVAARCQRIGLREILEQFRLLLRGHSDARIRDGLDPVAAADHPSRSQHRARSIALAASRSRSQAFTRTPGLSANADGLFSEPKSTIS